MPAKALKVGAIVILWLIVALATAWWTSGASTQCFADLPGHMTEQCE
jgi:hypothetical protein